MLKMTPYSHWFLLFGKYIYIIYINSPGDEKQTREKNVWNGYQINLKKVIAPVLNMCARTFRCGGG